MARKRMVTRTIKTTDVTLLCLDIETAEVSNRAATLPKICKTEDEMLDLAKPIFKGENVRPVHVVEYTSHEHKYGMTEEAFIAAATEM